MQAITLIQSDKLCLPFLLLASCEPRTEIIDLSLTNWREDELPTLSVKTWQWEIGDFLPCLTDIKRRVIWNWAKLYCKTRRRKGYEKQTHFLHISHNLPDHEIHFYWNSPTFLENTSLLFLQQMLRVYKGLYKNFTKLQINKLVFEMPM